MINSIVANIIKGISATSNPKERLWVKEQITNQSVSSWRDMWEGSTVATGFLTGIVGGPFGIAATIGDFLYCGRAAGLGACGIGYIIRGEIDDSDLENIIIKWSGVGEIMSTVPAGKVGIKIAGKVSTKLIAKVTGMVVAQLAFKAGFKAGGKLLAKVSSKLATKLAVKVSGKVFVSWIPIVGGLVSAGINYWIIGSFLQAAEDYYRAVDSNTEQFLVVDQDCFA